MPPKQAAPTHGIDALPSKMQNRFREVTRCHEQKDYTRGLALCQEILAAHPTHPDTTAFKALTLHSQNPIANSKEAYDLVKESLLKSMFQSGVCWQVLAQMHRDDQQYVDALAAMKKAADLSPEPANTLRDVSYLQLRVGDYKGFEATRLKMLQAQFSVGANWILYAVAQQLVESYMPAYHIASIYLQTVVPAGQSITEAGGDSGSSYELAEIRRYMGGLLVAAGQYAKALEFLRAEEPHLVDKVSYHTLVLKCATMLEKINVMEKTAMHLCKYNPEDFTAVAALMRARQAKKGVKRVPLKPPVRFARNVLRDDDLVDASQSTVPPVELWTPFWWQTAPAALRESVCEDLDALPKELAGVKADAYLNRTLAVSMVGDGSVGHDFAQRLTRVMRRYISRMIPSLPSVLKPLYADPSKVPVVDAALRNVIKALETSSRLPSGDDFSSSSATVDSDPLLPPCALAWTLVTMASHHKRCGRLDEALKVADMAVCHTPTMEVARMRLARLLLKKGDREAAAEQMHHARRLDLSDRHVNVETVKVLLAAGRQYAYDADRTYALFDFTYQDDQNIHPLSTVIEFQVVWLHLNEAAMYLREGDYVSAVRHYLFVDHVASEFPDDVEIFVPYCVRKGTMTSLLEAIEHDASKYAKSHQVTCAVGLMHALLRAEDVVGGKGTREEGAAELTEKRYKFTRRTRFRGKFAGKDVNILPPRIRADNVIVQQGVAVDNAEDETDRAAEQALQEKLWGEKEASLRLPTVNWKAPLESDLAARLVERLQTFAAAYPIAHIVCAEYYLARVDECGRGLARVLQAITRLGLLLKWADEAHMQLPKVKSADRRSPQEAMKALVSEYDAKYSLSVGASVVTSVVWEV